MLIQILVENSIKPNLHYINKYLSFINSCKSEKFIGPIEQHHIIPRSFGGSDNDNVIKLSPRCHFIAHLMLAKATHSPKMIKALHRMIYSRNGDAVRDYKINSKIYEYLRIEHADVVRQYSKNTVVAKNLITNEIKRIPKDLFDSYNGLLYQALAKGRKDSEKTRLLKKIASKRPRTVKLSIEKRSRAASKYSYLTPKGYCDSSKDLLKLYPTFTKNTLLLINNDYVITSKFVSSHPEFSDHVGKKLSDIGFKREIK